MAHRVIVQDGNVLYATSDPLADISFNVSGVMSITKQVNVGDNPAAAGLIQTPPSSGVDLIFRTNTDGVLNGNIKFEPVTGGSILLNNIAWPDGTTTPVPGMYLGVSSTNTLQFYSLPPSSAGAIVPATAIGTAGDLAGKIVYDTDFFYVCVADYDGVSNIWKKTALVAF